MKNVIADTSILVECAANKVDMERELRRILDCNFQLGVLDRTIDELNEIIQKGPNKKEGKAAKLTETILVFKKVVVFPTPGRRHTDTILFEMADDEHIIATQDKELKKRLKGKGQPCIVLRQKKKLALLKA